MDVSRYSCFGLRWSKIEIFEKKKLRSSFKALVPVPFIASSELGICQSSPPSLRLL